MRGTAPSSDIQVPLSPLEFRRYNPFRRAAANWERAVELAASGRRTGRGEEPIVRRAVAYLRGGRTLPDIARAHELYRLDGPLTWQLKALLLTDLTFHDIVARVHRSAEIIAAFEGLFFNVRDGGRLRGHDWIHCSVLAPPSDPSNPSPSLIWQCMGLAAGPIMVDLLVEDYLGLPDPDIKRRAVFAAQARFAVRLAYTPMADAKAWEQLLRELRQQPWFASWSRGHPVDNNWLRVHLRFLRLTLKTTRLKKERAALPVRSGDQQCARQAVKATSAEPHELHKRRRQRRRKTHPRDNLPTKKTAAPAAPRMEATAPQIKTAIPAAARAAAENPVALNKSAVKRDDSLCRQGSSVIA